jgi:membrane associated rhomboid family serine protease
MKLTDKGYRWAARAGLILGPLGWALNQQFTSNFTYSKCELSGTPLVLASGVICGLIAVTGLVFSWSARRRFLQEPPADVASTTPFTATLGAMAAAMFLLVIIAGTAAGFVLPGCYR